MQKVLAVLTIIASFVLSPFMDIPLPPPRSRKP